MTACTDSCDVVALSPDMIPVNEPWLGERELEYVTECVRSGWISSAGRFIDEFEQSWAAYCGRGYGVAVSNGTAALQTAVAALRLQPGDEVILPTFTIISCAIAVVGAGAIPVLVDCDRCTWTMDVNQVADAVLHMANLPLETNVQFMTIMATKMPLVGRG